MIRWWLAIAGIGGFVSVGAGALGAHLAVPAQAALLRTGATYGLVHAAALLAVAAWCGRGNRPSWCLAIAGCGFAAGIVLFSFSLFGLALSGWAPIARAAPVGGVALMVGWAALAVAALRL